MLFTSIDRALALLHVTFHISLLIPKVSDFLRGKGETIFTNPARFHAAGVQLPDLIFQILFFLTWTRPCTCEAWIKTSEFSSLNYISCYNVSAGDPCANVVKVLNREAETCRWNTQPLSLPQRSFEPAFMHLLSPRCCLKTLTKHIHLNCHTLHFCFPNCAIISHEWCSSLTQLPRNILHTEKH